MTATVKTCSTCKTTKASIHFSRKAASPDGLGSLCKVCASAANKAWRKKGTRKEVKADRLCVCGQICTHRRRTCGDLECIKITQQEGGRRIKNGQKPGLVDHTEATEQLDAAKVGLRRATEARATDTELAELRGAVLALLRLCELMIPAVTKNDTTTQEHQ